MIARIAILLGALISTASPYAEPFDLAVHALAVAHIERFGIPPESIMAVAHVETGGTYRRDLVSRRGACGVMQVMPKWSSWSCEEMGGHLAGVTSGAVAWVQWDALRSSLFSTAEHYNGGTNPGSAAKVYGRQWERQRNRIASSLGKFTR